MPRTKSRKFIGNLSQEEKEQIIKFLFLLRQARRKFPRQKVDLVLSDLPYVWEMAERMDMNNMAVM